MRRKPHASQEPHGGPGRGRRTGDSVEKQVDSLLLSLQPTTVADERRRAVFEHVQEVIQREVPECKIFPVGSFPLKTYLPYADVDMVMFSRRGAGGVRARSDERMGTTDDIPGGDEGETADAVRPSALVAVNQALCMVAACSGVRRGNPPRSRPWTPSAEAGNPEIRNVQFINARTPVITVVVGNVHVDVTENQGGSVAASALLEEADNLIQRDHLFKRSLLLLKAWAWCETPRLVGRRVLGAQRGGLTSYGLSVMVLHLFAVRSSAEDLVHPLDVLVRFFEVYSEFDWSRYCLTLDGPVPFESVHEPSQFAAFSGEGETTSRLQPLVRKVLAALSPGLEKEKEDKGKGKGEKSKEKEKEKEKSGRRGRRASRSGRNSDARGKPSSPADVDAAGAAATAATAPHFPKRICNIQDPLNALNNLGHSVTKNNLQALERAIRYGRQQLEAWRLLSNASPSRLPWGDDQQQRPCEPEVAQSAGPPQGGRKARRHTGPVSVEAGARLGAEGQRMESAGFVVDPCNEAAASPAGEQGASASRVPRHFGPLAPYVLAPPLQSAYPQPVLMPVHYPLATREGQPIVLAYPQPCFQAAPHQNLFSHQPQPYMVPQGQGQGWPGPGMLQPYPAVMVPAYGAHGRPEFLPQWPLQGVLPAAYQGDNQVGPDHNTFSRMSVLPPSWRDQATARSEVLIAGPEAERQRLASSRVEMKGFPIEKESCRGEAQNLQDDSHAHDPGMQEPRSPLESSAFNMSRTSSTASLSDFVEDGSKESQDCQLQYESSAENDLYGRPAKENLFVSSFDGSDHSDAMMDTRHAERGDGFGAGMKGMNGSLWTNWFLKEFFPECCHRYGAGDGFREDLLDHPCQRRSKLQEPGSPRQSQTGAPDVLQGASRDIWKSLTTVGEILRETGPHTGARNVKGVEAAAGAEAEAAAGVAAAAGAEAGTRTNIEGEKIESGVGGQGGGNGVARGARARGGRQAEVERHLARDQRPSVVACAFTGGGPPAPSANSGGNARGVGVNASRPKGQSDEVGSGRQRGAGSSTVRVSVDDEAGYTTSEEQGGREDSISSSAPQSPPVGSPCLVERPPSSTSTRTLELISAPAGKAGGDVGLQSVGPVAKLMVSTASQCEGPARISISTGVQCSMPAPAPASAPLVSRGSQFCGNTTTQGSIGVQCALLVEEAGETPPGASLSPSTTSAGFGGQRSPACCSSKNALGDCGGEGLPRPSGAEEAISATVPPDSSAVVGMDDRRTSSKSAKRRKKAKSAARGAAGRPSVVCSVGGRRRLMSGRGVVFCAVIGGLVLAVVWGLVGRPEAPRWEGGGLVGRGDPLESQSAVVAQLPVWVVIGGSLTLGDEVASRRPAAKGDGAGGVQWFKDGRLLPGQTRSFLTISVASAEDEGTYACFAVEESGRMSNKALWEEATVRISEPPTVESQLQTQRLARGEMLAIIASASGVPQPEYQWRRNGVPIVGANRPMLVRHSVSEADMGTYTCDVYNVAGNAQWEEMAVILREDGPERR